MAHNANAEPLQTSVRQVRLWESIWLGLAIYSFTSLIPILGVVVGHDFFNRPSNPLRKQVDEIRAFANWDGEHYMKILTDSYTYDQRRPSNVAFFPAYPMLGRLVAKGTGADPDLALLIVSHVSLMASFVLFAAYSRVREVSNGSQLNYFALLAFGLFPTTFFWRMAYSESLFVFGCLLVFYGMARRWPLLLLSLLVGFTTATRPVGVVLLPPFIFHLWGCSGGVGQFFSRLGCYLLPACWGIVCYMIYLYLAFGDPLVFAKTQTNWNLRPATTPAEKIVSLVTLEPVWCVFDRSSPCYWRKHEFVSDPLFTLTVTNPIYFLAAVGLALFGAWRGWLNRLESVFCFALILVPYILRSREMCMDSSARFVATVFPLYFVLGRFLQLMPTPVATVLLSICGFFLGIYAALFASWYRVI
jgi:hypothetical protein